jgi:hypothetical protein
VAEAFRTPGERFTALPEFDFEPRIGRKIDHLIPHAGHGLQEDQGPLVGGLIVDWLSSGPT